MSRRLQICEQWDIPVPEAAPGPRRESSWFLDWVMRRPEETSKHVACGYWAFKNLYELGLRFTEAVEVFGGAGCQSRIIQEIFRPKGHFILEDSEAAYEHLYTTMGPKQGVLKGVLISRGDAFVTPWSAVIDPGDLVAYDAGDLTAHQLAKGRHGELLWQIFQQKPGAVVLTDIAGPKLHLHSKIYREVLGDYQGYEGYLYALNNLVYSSYGYRASVIYHHKWSAVFALVPQEYYAETEVRVVPAAPVGLRILDA